MRHHGETMSDQKSLQRLDGRNKPMYEIKANNIKRCGHWQGVDSKNMEIINGKLIHSTLLEKNGSIKFHISECIFTDDNQWYECIRKN